MKDKIKNLIIFTRENSAQVLKDINSKKYNYYIIGGKRTIEFFLTSKKVDRFKITYIKDGCLNKTNETSPIFFPELGELLATQTKFISHSSSQCYIGEGSLV
jgi:dihydrofolate reductase